ncbi:hypothetical protein OTU49_005826, partial [Cherax quadricarinatus]
EPPSTLIGCYYHDVTTDSAAVTCSPGPTSSQLPEIFHIEVREGSTVVAAYNNTEPRFNITSLAPGRDYVLSMFASHAKGGGHRTTLLMKTHTPKAEQVAPERVSVNLSKQGERAPHPTEPPRGRGGAPVSVVVSGVVVGVVVGVAVVVAGVVTCRARRGHASSSSSSSPGKTHQHQSGSRDSLLELSQGAMYQSSASHPSCELLTTFSPGPVVVTQLNPGRSSRRASTLSAPGGSSPRDFHRRAPSVSGDPVHVLEVEDDDITTPRVEIHSPSRLPRINLTSEDLKGQDSPPLLSLRCEPLQQALSQARPQVSPQPELESGSSEQQAETHTALDAETQTGDLELSPEAHAQHFTQSHSLTQTHPMTHIHSIPQVYPTPHVHSTPQVQSTPEVHPTTHIHPTTYIHPTTQVHQTHQAQPSCQVQSTSQAHPTTLDHLTPQTHSTTHLHSQLQTDTLLAIQSSTATLPHTATLPRSTFKSHHTGTTPQLALLSQPALSQQHTGAVPRPATHAYTGTASQQCATTLPRGLTLSQLASQVHSVPQDTSWHQCQPTPQQLSAPQAHLLLRPPENEPPAHHQPQAQPLTLTERSLHPDSVTHQHLIPPDNT